MRVQLLLLAAIATSHASFVLLDPNDYKQNFVEGWPGPYSNGTNAGLVNRTTVAWATANLPLFEASDADMQGAYYYRAKSYRSHMNPTDYVDQPVVVSEFGAAVHWGGPYGSINAAAGHHISEGRWIRDRTAMNSNIKFWCVRLRTVLPRFLLLLLQLTFFSAQAQLYGRRRRRAAAAALRQRLHRPGRLDAVRALFSSLLSFLIYSLLTRRRYTMWVVSAVAKDAEVRGEFELGDDR